jgi:hypothetical protein
MEHGVKKKYTNFDAFNIYDMVKDIATCEYCRKGLGCETHGLSRDANRKVMQT